MEYVFVIDSEGYVFKKLELELTSDEKIITENEYLKKSGLATYEKENCIMIGSVNYKLNDQSQ